MGHIITTLQNYDDCATYHQSEVYLYHKSNVYPQAVLSKTAKQDLIINQPIMNTISPLMQ